MLLYFAAWTNNLSDFEDDGYSDVDEEESDEEFNQKSEGNNQSMSQCLFLPLLRVILIY